MEELTQTTDPKPLTRGELWRKVLILTGCETLLCVMFVYSLPSRGIPVDRWLLGYRLIAAVALPYSCGGVLGADLCEENTRDGDDSYLSIVITDGSGYMFCGAT